MSNQTATGHSYGIAPPGYRLPEATRLGRVVLQVADLERSTRFYQRVLGLGVLESAGQRAVLGDRSGEWPIVELRERRGAVPVPRRGRLGLYHFAILLPDRASLGRFAAHLAQLGIAVGASDHRVSEALYLQDPDGLGIEVYADRPRSEWRQADRQLVMATDPLDMQSLLEAGGGVEWDGAPEGTVLGHVHLHVGDLEQAAAFYHEALGLDRVVWSYPGALFLSAGGYHHHLGVNSWAAGAEPAGHEDAKLLEWEILLPSVAEAKAAMRSLADHGHRVNATGDGGVAYDPSGTALRIRSEVQP